MPNPVDPPDIAAKKERYRYSTDQLMNQFLKTEGGGLGRSPEFRRGYEWNFVWNSDDPAKAQPLKVRAVERLMEGGMSFEQAFDEIDLAGTR